MIKEHPLTDALFTLISLLHRHLLGFQCFLRIQLGRIIGPFPLIVDSIYVRVYLIRIYYNALNAFRSLCPKNIFMIVFPYLNREFMSFFFAADSNNFYDEWHRRLFKVFDMYIGSLG